MQGVTIGMLLECAGKFGLAGIVVVQIIVFYFSTKNQLAMLQAYRDDTQEADKRREMDMKEVRQMYENNVRLVDDYHEVARDLKEILILNTQTLTQTLEGIRRGRADRR